MHEKVMKLTLQRDELLALKKKSQAQIVSSPDRFRKQIVDTESSLTEVQGEDYIEFRILWFT